jgi:peptidoglycan hydrolase CwlO-like protein
MDRRSESLNPISSRRAGRQAKRGPLRYLVVLTALGALLAFPLAHAGADSITDLNSKIASAQSQAQGLAAEVDAKAAQAAAARQQAATAAAREAQLSAVLAKGQQREAELETRVQETQAHLVKTRARLHRALRQLSQRLVDIYQGDSPDAAELLLSSRGFADLANRAELLGRIQDSDASLAGQVRSLRNQVADELAQVKDARAQAIAFNQRVSAARDQIASVRANAEAQAAALQQAQAQAAAAANSLRSQVSGWESQVQQIQAIQAQQAQQAAASQQAAAAQAQQTVSSWVGNWAIPQAIVECESGGNFNAVNPSSGAGGAYQILPSTWQMYGGSGAPQNASPSQQSAIASQIWADSGPSAWECAQ